MIPSPSQFLTDLYGSAGGAGYSLSGLQTAIAHANDEQARHTSSSGGAPSGAQGQSADPSRVFAWPKVENSATEHVLRLQQQQQQQQQQGGSAQGTAAPSAGSSPSRSDTGTGAHEHKPSLRGLKRGVDDEHVDDNGDLSTDGSTSGKNARARLS